MASTPIKPKIDDQFWFNYSEKLINDSHSNTDAAAKKMQNLVLWLWGIYTTYAAVGTSLQENNFPWFITLLIAFTSVSLIIVYWGTTWVQMPVKSNFDPRSPDDIKEAYLNITSTKIYRFNTTLLLSFLAAFMVSLSLILMSMNGEKEIPKYDFIASIDHTSNIQTVGVTANVADVKKVTIQVVDSNNSIIKNLIVIPTNLGIVQTNVAVRQSPYYTVSIHWKDTEGTKVQLSKKLMNPKIAKL